MIDFVINGILWQVKLVPPSYPMLFSQSSGFTLGCCNSITQSIYISDGLNWQKFEKVLCHEITHAAMFSYNVQLTYDQEELIADIIATYGSEVINITNKVFKKIKDRF